MAAMMEGNMPAMSGFLAGGKPTLATVYWSYAIVSNNGCLEKLTILKENQPYSTYHAKKGEVGVNIVRNTMKYLFELSSGISQELPEYEIIWFLSMIHEITYELTSLIRCNRLD